MRLSYREYSDKRVDFNDLEGKTIADLSVEPDSGSRGDKVVISTEEGITYEMGHRQDCCEYVRVEDITGSISNLIGEEVVQARETVNNEEEYETHEPGRTYTPASWTWTFYDIATRRGRVTIRWLGESNGYYSERVDVVKREVKNEQN